MLNAIGITLVHILWYMLLCVRRSIYFITIVVSALLSFRACPHARHRDGTIRFLKTFLLLCHSSLMYSVVNFITTIIFEGLARCKDIFVAISVAHLSITLSLTIICNKFHYTFKETLSRVNKVLVK